MNDRKKAIELAVSAGFSDARIEEIKTCSWLRVYRIACDNISDAGLLLGTCVLSEPAAACKLEELALSHIC